MADAKKKIVSDEPVEAFVTNEIPEGVKVEDGVEIDAPDVIIKAKVKVITEFIDKTVLAETGDKIAAYRKVGNVFDADIERANELAALGFVKII